MKLTVKSRNLKIERKGQDRSRKKRQGELSSLKIGFERDNNNGSHLSSARHAFHLLRQKHPQTLHASRAGAKVNEKRRKGRRASLLLKVGLLAKVEPIEPIRAYDSGTVPRQAQVVFHL
jgi:hypothetical protein